MSTQDYNIGSNADLYSPEPTDLKRSNMKSSSSRRSSSNNKVRFSESIKVTEITKLSTQEDQEQPVSMIEKIRQAKQKNLEFEDFMRELRAKRDTEEEELQGVLDGKQPSQKPLDVLDSLSIAKQIALDLNLSSNSKPKKP